MESESDRMMMPMFRDALWVFLRKRFLSTLRGPWMPHEPDDATSRLFCVGRPLPASSKLIKNVLSNGGRAAFARTLEELHLQLEKAVKQRDWETAVNAA
jgi:hypothetical protein